MWSALITVAMQIIGFFIKKNAQDEEAERKFLELANHLQAKKLISAKVKFDRDGRLERLRKKRAEAQAKDPNKEEM